MITVSALIQCMKFALSSVVMMWNATILCNGAITENISAGTQTHTKLVGWCTVPSRPCLLLNSCMNKPYNFCKNSILTFFKPPFWGELNDVLFPTCSIFKNWSIGKIVFHLWTCCLALAKLFRFLIQNCNNLNATHF